MMILTDPNNPSGMNPLYMDDADNFADEYEYDEFIGKWRRKKRKHRIGIPRIIATRIRPHRKKIAQRKLPRYPKESVIKKPPVRPVPPVPPLKNKPEDVRRVKEVKDPTARKGSLENPINNRDLKSHKVMNNAVQNELKTMQEELKTEGLKKKVEQEDLKKESLKQQAGLMGAGRGLIVVAGVLGIIAMIAYLKK